MSSPGDQKSVGNRWHGTLIGLYLWFLRAWSAVESVFAGVHLLSGRAMP